MSKQSVWHGGWCLSVAWLVLVGLADRPLWASKVVMKDGRTYEGRFVVVGSVGEDALNVPLNGAPKVQLILLCDDYLRRIFLPKKLVQSTLEAEVTPMVSFNIRQYVADSGGRVSQLGPPLRITEFDEFGRRIYTMNANQGKIDVIQGITKITPLWTKVEAIHKMQGKNFIWDMRMATSSIPPDVLRQIIARQIDPNKIEDRLRLVQLFLQGERYQDAQAELNLVIQAFPGSKQRFEGALRDLRQAFARKALSEIDVRTNAGQHKLAINLLENFPNEGIAGETLQAVRQSLDEYRTEFDRYTEILQQVDQTLGKVAAPEQGKAQPIVDEIKKELNIHTLGRLAAFRQFLADPALNDQEKLSLALSGWLVGTDDALRKLPVALSLFDVRNLVRQYLAEPTKVKRDQILADLTAQEGATPELVAKLLRYMLPPVETKTPEEGPPGFYELSVNGLPGEGPVTYYVQVPPEYDPHRIYPTVVTLNGAGSTPRQQIDWWAGAVGPNGQRLGQATRFGYIVVAPAWSNTGQVEYGFSAAEHGAVLNSLRDACRRFSIDTDHVFISGHSMGGDAAWDLALSHPDLWAGVMPVVARAEKYISLLWDNMKLVPFYLVSGELDGDKRKANATDIDRYLNRGYNATVVEFQGRGHEHFSDEIQRLFEWMNRLQRDFFPKSFVTKSMRPWDNYFWWLELADFAQKTMVDPEEWPKKGSRPAQTTGEANANNGLVVKTGAGKT
ncbi:MAG TPA: peptidase, partial [Pirellulales bacterium]|nr:peptidase [Pirellulales bacterium]